jgi:hypothetical protein
MELGSNSRDKHLLDILGGGVIYYRVRLIPWGKSAGTGKCQLFDMLPTLIMRQFVGLTFSTNCGIKDGALEGPTGWLSR